MIYVIAIVMGYLIGTNGMVQRRAKGYIGMGYANKTWGLLSELGGLGGWFCILPAAYFVGSAYESGFWQGVLFCFATMIGAILSGLFKIPALSYLLSALALPINVGLAALVFVITRM